MRKTILISLLALLIGSISFAQTNYDTISVTYTSGDIGTTKNFRYDGDSSSCPGMLNVPVPDGAIVVSVDVEYDMTASYPQKIYYQRSQLWCTSPGGTKEPQVYNGVGWGYGTYHYNRTGLDIAFGIQPQSGQGVDFELHAGTNYYNASETCSTQSNRVDDGTWTVKVIYLPPGSPGFATNPSPADGEMLVGLNPTLTWDFGDNTDSYDIFIGTVNPPDTWVVNDSPVNGETSGSYTPQTLQPGTEYFWRVISNNETNEVEGTVWSFKTVCETPVYPYVENFDGVTVPDLPDCWVPLKTPTSNIRTTATSQSLSYPNMVMFEAGASVQPDVILVLPEVENIADLMLTMYGKNDVNWNNNEPYSFPFEIGTMSDPFDASTFEVYDSYVPGDNWTAKEVYFNNYTGTNTYIAIRADVPQYNVLYMDDVTLDEIPSCMKPLELTLDSITTGEATISWTDLWGSPGEWEIEYGPEGFELGTGTQITANSNPFTITGLQDAMYYDVYARSVCGDDETSDWSWPLTILTECLPKDIPLFEDFGMRPPYPQVAELPICWSVIEESATGGAVVLTNSASYTGYSGIGVMFDPRNDPNAQLILVGPEMDPYIGTLQAGFWAKRATNGGDNGLIVGTIEVPGDYTTFTPYDTIKGLTSDWVYYTVYFVDYTGTDSYIAWRHNSEEYQGNRVYLDEITIDEAPSCIFPVNLEVTAVTESTATFNWKNVGGNTSWTIKVGDIGFDPDVDPAHLYVYGNSGAPGYLSYTTTGLNAATRYDGYIKTNCSSTESSDWAGPVTFLTSYDQLSLPVYEDFENGLGIMTNGFDNIKDWEMNTTLFVSGSQSVYNKYGRGQNNSLYMMGSFDLTSVDDAMLSFYHIAKTDGNYDHCYVEISTNGGATFEPLPISTYKGVGNYREEGLYNFPEGPCFDEDSYPQWGTGYQTPNNTWWKKEYFDLSAYSMYDHVTFRFRIFTNNYGHKAGWFIDDVRVGEIEVPVFAVDPSSITETLNDNESMNLDMNFSNAGGFPSQFTATIVYDQTVLIDEDFNDSIPGTWTLVNNGTSDTVWRWNQAYQTYYTFDGTPFAFCNGQKPSGEYDPRVDAELISPVVDASAYLNEGLLLEFDQAYQDYYQPGDTARVYVFDGNEWVMIYEKFNGSDGKLSYNSNGVHKIYNVSAYANENFQVKFNYIVASGTKGYYYAIDNVKLRASDNPLGWLTIDGGEEVSGVVYPDADNTPVSLDVMLDAQGIPGGTYSADIEITTEDPNNAQITVPVTLTVVALPYNISFWCIDQDGAPMEGVDVTIGDETVTSDESGLALFANYVFGTYNYTAVKSGYGTVEGTITVDGADVEETVVMIPGYNISFWCVEDGSPLEGVYVTIDDQTVVSDGDGLALFVDYIPGEYTYSATMEGYGTISGTVNVVDAPVEVTIDMALAIYDVTFWCVDEDGLPMEGVEVTFNYLMKVSDETGMVLFENYGPGEYNYMAKKTGYETVTGTITLVDASVEITVEMVLQRYDILFTCVGEDGDPLPGVDVTIDDVTITSGTDGIAMFTNYLIGDYDYEAVKEAYVTVEGTVSVVDEDVNETVVMMMVKYNMSFWCVDENGDPLAGVDVTIDTETVTSDESGLALFSDYDPGYYYYMAMKPGYSTVSGTTNLVDQDVDINITMPFENYVVTFTVMDEEENPLQGAEVNLDGNVVTTDDNGEAVFDNMVTGTYSYIVTKAGYETVEGDVEVMSGDVNVNVTMQLLTGVSDITLEDVNIYPNPVKYSVNIDNAANATLRLMNQYGQTIMTKELKESHVSFSVESIPAGIYYIILTNNKHRYSHKLLIAK